MDEIIYNNRAFISPSPRISEYFMTLGSTLYLITFPREECVWFHCNSPNISAQQIGQAILHKKFSLPLRPDDEVINANTLF